ncbi:MAG: DUF2975 domain-containing protein [Clostridia bacterium]|nr:DUF2975 domain-containing protein [Clostridia bacterium]
MFKNPGKVSIVVSMAFAIVLAVAIVIGAVVIPDIVGFVVDMVNLNYQTNSIIQDNIDAGNLISNGQSVLLLVVSYLVLVTAMAADFMLFALLLRVCKGKVFTNASVSLIRGVSLCCFFAGITVFVTGTVFRLAFVLGFAAFFLGFCLYVVKNVLAEATRIKNENDLTV